MENSTNYNRLLENLKYLNLKQIELHLGNELESNTLSLVDGLLKLTDYEVDNKRVVAAHQMIKMANFPHTKSLKDFDFSFNPEINENQIKILSSLAFLENNKNIVFLGNSGVGKTHLSISIGIEAARRRVSTYFIKCQDLLESLKKSQLENRLESRLKHYAKYKLLIIDELGYLPLNRGDERLLFQLIDRRYENKSTIITTNLDFSEWSELFYDEKIAAAIIDRLLHHAIVVPITGKSYRLKDHIKQED